MLFLASCPLPYKILFLLRSMNSLAVGWFSAATHIASAIASKSLFFLSPFSGDPLVSFLCPLVAPKHRPTFGLFNRTGKNSA